MRTSRFIVGVTFLFCCLTQICAQSTIHKVWTMKSQSVGYEILFDFTNKGKMIEAHRYTQKQLDQLGLKRYEPGVWHIKKERNYKVNFYDNDSGEILCENPCGDFDPEWTFSGLTASTVDFSFGNAYMLEAKNIGKVTYAERERLEINIDDMLNIFSVWCDNTMEHELAGKEGMHRLNKKEETDDDKWYWEAWGRDLEYSNLSWVKKGPKALGILLINRDNQEVELVFADKDMVPILETQMAQMGFLKQTTRTAEGIIETVYAPKGWKNHSGEYYFVLSRDQQWTEEYGLYNLFYTIDY